MTSCRSCENVTRGRGMPASRLAAVAEHYYAFGGVSPINQQCRDLLAAIGKDFAAAGVDLPVYWGNRNWDPYLTDTVAEMAADGVRRALAFVTSAYGSYSSCRQYLDDIERARAEAGPGAPEIDKLRHFFNHPGFIEPLPTPPGGHRRRCRRPRGRSRLVFTAHSVPDGDGRGQRAAAGGRYPAELAEASRLVAERAGAGPGGGHPWQLVYQSRSGPPSQPWLGPDVGDFLERAGRGRGSRRRSGPGRLRQPTTWRSARPGRRGGADRRPAGPAAGPGGHPGHRPALRGDDHRAGHRAAGRPGAARGAGPFGGRCRPATARRAAAWPASCSRPRPGRPARQGPER